MNKVMLIGNVGKEPDVRYYDADQAVAQVTFATTEKGYTLANGTQVPDRTEWHTLVFYRTLAKIVEKYVHKGDKLYVEGRLRYRSYDDKKGMRRYVTEIYADNMELLTPRSAHAAAAQAVQWRIGLIGYGRVVRLRKEGLVAVDGHIGLAGVFRNVLQGNDLPAAVVIPVKGRCNQQHRQQQDLGQGIFSLCGFRHGYSPLSYRRSVMSGWEKPSSSVSSAKCQASSPPGKTNFSSDG